MLKYNLRLKAWTITTLFNPKAQPMAQTGTCLFYYQMEEVPYEP